ncbi:BadF/BadG/BcrA/BcrD ATPase family protein, partial [Staphylococcus sp. SIMBA_130]
VTVNIDAINALYSGTLGKPGIVQIAGTGSITFSINHDGLSDRVGGWGYLIGEMGSGFALGRDALEAAFLAHDGLGTPT